jgi:hypothetical protein
MDTVPHQRSARTHPQLKCKIPRAAKYHHKLAVAMLAKSFGIKRRTHTKPPKVLATFATNNGVKMGGLGLCQIQAGNALL